MLEFKIDSDTAGGTMHVGGMKRVKTVSASDLCNLFAQQSRATNIVVPPGCRQVIENGNSIAYLFITPGYKGVAAVYWRDNDISEFGKLENYMPSEERADMFGDYDRKNIRIFPIPFPASAVLVRFNKQSDGTLTFNNMWCWALKDINMPLEQLQAYRWPLTNIYGNHRVCIGEVPGRISHIDAAAAYVRYLYNGLGNHDLDSNATYASGDYGLGRIKYPYEMITKIKDTDVFPVDYLNPVGDLQSAVQAALGNR